MQPPACSNSPGTCAAWDKVDDVLARFLGLDESKYQWAIDAQRIQQQQVRRGFNSIDCVSLPAPVLATRQAWLQLIRDRGVTRRCLLQEEEAREIALQAVRASSGAEGDAVSTAYSCCTVHVMRQRSRACHPDILTLLLPTTRPLTAAVSCVMQTCSGLQQ